jgi:hypothetical protein
VLGAICDGFADGTAPPVCSCQTVPISNMASCVSPPAAASGMPGWASGLIATFVLGSLAVGGWVWYQRRQTRVEVEQALDDYRSLMETGDGGEAGDAPRVVRNLPTRMGGASGGGGGIGSRLGMLGKILQPPASAADIAAARAAPSTGVQ